MTEQQYKEWQQRVEDAKEDHVRSQGSLDELMRQLEKEFDSRTVKEGRALLLKIQDQRDRADEDFSKAEKAYLKKWDK